LSNVEQTGAIFIFYHDIRDQHKDIAAATDSELD